MGIAPGGGRTFAHAPVPQNYQALYQKFREQGRQSGLEDFAKQWAEATGISVRLSWKEPYGLTNINIGTQSGFDLDPEAITPAFEEHNHGGEYTLVAAAIAQEYVRQLLQSDEID